MDFFTRLPSVLFGDFQEDYVEEKELNRERKESSVSIRAGENEIFVDEFRDSLSENEDSRHNSLAVITIDDVAIHDTYDDCWIILYDKVYDITRFLSLHPGGDDVLMEYAGRDATIAFRSVGHSMGALSALNEFLIGVLPDSQRIFGSDSSCQWSIA